MTICARGVSVVGPAMTNPPVSNPPSLELLRRARAGTTARSIVCSNAISRRCIAGRTGASPAGRAIPWIRPTSCRKPSCTIRNLGSFEPQREGALLGYLRRSLLNRIRDRFRYAARHPAPAELTDTSADGGAFHWNWRSTRKIAAATRTRSRD